MSQTSSRSRVRLAVFLTVLALAIAVPFALVELTNREPENKSTSSNIRLIYDVTNLVAEAHSPTAKSNQAVVLDPPQLPPATQPSVVPSMADLIASIKHSATPDAWNNTTRIEAGENRLTVFAPPKTQQAVESYLHELKQRLVRISLQSHIVTIDAATLARADVKLPQTMPSGILSTPLAFLTDAQLKYLMSLSKANIHSPRATILNDQGCTLYQLTYFPYVGHLNIQTVDGKQTAAPKIEYANDGITIGMHARTSADLSSFLVAVAIKQMNFHGFKTSADPNHPNLSVQIPQQDDHQIAAVLSIPKGLSAVLPLSKDEVAIVTPQIVTP
jgi:hypothetical protein